MALHLTSSRRTSALAAVVLAGVLASTTMVSAQPLDDASRAAALALGSSGLDAYDAGRYEEASEKLEKAYVVARVPTIGLWSARALEKRGLWLEAAARYEDTAGLELAPDAPAAHAQARIDAQNELARLRARLPTVTVEIHGAPVDQVRLSYDGEPLALTPGQATFAANPGRHRLDARHGEATRVREIDLQPAERELVVVAFDAPAPVAAEAAPAATPVADTTSEGARPLRSWGWVSLGVGAAGIAVGTIALTQALSKKSDLDDSGECEERDCTPAASSLIDSYDSWKTVSTIGFVAGGVLAATGVALVLIDAPAGRAEAFVAPGFVGARGSF